MNDINDEWILLVSSIVLMTGIIIMKLIVWLLILIIEGIDQWQWWRLLPKCVLIEWPIEENWRTWLMNIEDWLRLWWY